VTMKSLKGNRSGFSIVLVIGVILIILLASVIVIFLPLKEVAIDERRESGSDAALEDLDFKLVSSMGAVTVLFEEDPEDLVTLQVSGTTRTSPIAGENPVRVSWDQRNEGNTLVITSEVKANGAVVVLPNLSITLTISKQLRANLSVFNTLGELEMVADGEVRLLNVGLRSSTGDVRVHLLNGTALEGNMTVDAATGAIGLVWSEGAVSGSGTMSLHANVGAINVNFTQSEELGGDLSLDLTAEVGGVGLIMDIAGNNSARVVSHAQVGDIEVPVRDGFIGSEDDLTSGNHPDEWTIDAEIGANVGDITLELTYSH